MTLVRPLICLFVCSVCELVVHLAVAVLMEQSAEQRAHEVEAACIASVGRLVRGVLLLLLPCPRPWERVWYVLTICVCLPGDGQAAAGLGTLRAPAVGEQ